MACTCAPIYENVEQSMKLSQEVFLGIPIARKDFPGGPSEKQKLGGDRIFTFQVIAQFKGKKKKEIRIDSSKFGMCGADFRENSGLFLLFATKRNGALSTTICSSALVGNDPKITTLIRDLAAKTS